MNNTSTFGRSALWRTGTWLVFCLAMMIAIPTAVRAPGAEGSPAASPTMTPPLPAADRSSHEPLEIPFSQPLQLMRRGGLMMWGIALCSVLLAALVFERLVALRRSRVIPRPFVKRLLPQIREGRIDQDQALALCRENGTPIAQILGAAAAKWGRPAVEVEQAIVDAGERATFSLRNRLRVFSALHTLGPLLGLVGTVFGIITAFNSLALGDEVHRAERLASGIAQSLLSTAFGLLVAVPALIFYLWFLSKADRLVFEMDALGQELVGLISAEGLQARKPEPKRTKTEPKKLAS